MPGYIKDARATPLITRRRAPAGMAATGSAAAATQSGGACAALRAAAGAAAASTHQQAGCVQAHGRAALRLPSAGAACILRSRSKPASPLCLVHIYRHCFAVPQPAKLIQFTPHCPPQHTREPAVLAELRAATAEQFATGARMQISPEQGAFMGWLVQVGKCGGTAWLLGSVSMDRCSAAHSVLCTR